MFALCQLGGLQERAVSFAGGGAKSPKGEEQEAKVSQGRFSRAIGSLCRPEASRNAAV